MKKTINFLRGAWQRFKFRKNNGTANLEIQNLIRALDRLHNGKIKGFVLTCDISPTGSVSYSTRVRK